MSCLRYRNAELFIEHVRVEDIADQFGTPCYIYSKTAIENNWKAYTDAFQSMPHLLCYAVKANSNITVLRLFSKWQSGFEVVSLGELERVLAAGGDPQKIIFSGVGKTQLEISEAIKKGVFCLNVESGAELERIESIASSQNKSVNIAFRINPDIVAGSHNYIQTGRAENKFGIDVEEIIPLALELKNMPILNLIGLACHIGSQLTTLQPLLKAADQLIALYHELQKKGFDIRYINVGGGLGMKYQQENPPSPQAYAKSLEKKLEGLPVTLIVEPGRSLIGNAGILLTRVEYLKTIKDKPFAIVDAGMTELIRPSLYGAYHAILPIKLRSEPKKIYDIVGPVCESSDFIGKKIALAIHANDLIAIDSVGAYGFSMSSNYNSRCRPPEILVDHTVYRLIRRRESLEELFAEEYIFLPIETEKTT